MAAPCINDTCSVTSIIDPITRRLELDVRYGGGGLQCVDGLGLGALLYGNPARTNPVDPCFQQLRMTAAGELFSEPGRVRYKDFGSSSEVGVPYTGGYSSNPIDSNTSVANPYNCAAMAIIYGRFRIRYSIGNEATGALPANSISDGALTWFPYHANIKFEFNSTAAAAGPAGAEEVAYQNISGMRAVADTQSGDPNEVWVYFVSSRPVGAGDSVSPRAYAKHQEDTGGSGNTNQNVNTDDFDNGFKCNGRIIFLPMNGEVIVP
jgi:hypothetical protein